MIKCRDVGATVGIDIGGTFTDAVVMDEAGGIRTFKAPTTPKSLLEGLLDNLEEAARADGASVGDFLTSVDRIAHGTTAATNAFIERRGSSVALLTTRGFEDTLFMQRMLGMTSGLSRSELTDYSKRSVPEPLCPRRLVFGVRERVNYQGEIVGPLQEADVHAAADVIRAEGVGAVAISFLWAFKNPEHERRAAEILAEALPDVYVSVSSELVPRLGEYERTATTVINAYLGPAIFGYVNALQEELPQAPVLLLDSSGGVMTPKEAGRAPVRLLLSGPSGGITASQYLGEALGHEDIITFDMGGTSADVGLITKAEPIRRHETESGKYHLLLPMVDIQTIGAGGGSIATVEEGGYLRVGPASAGAQPGPACYGRGGEWPTVTDADLVLGILDPERFLGGRIALDTRAARAAISDHIAEPLGMSVEEAAAGIRRIVDTRMADLLRTVTIERGHDPRDFVLYAFGGAGPTHAPAFALDLVDVVIIPSSQSVHSALGAIASDITLMVEQAVPTRIGRDQSGADDELGEIQETFAGLEERAGQRLSDQGVPSERQEFTRLVEMRFARQVKSLSVPMADSLDEVIEDFLRLYAARYGQEAVPDVAGFELVTLVVEARGRLPRPSQRRMPRGGVSADEASRGCRSVYDTAAGEFVETKVYDGTALSPGNQLTGPCIVQYPGTTVALTTGQSAQVDELLSIEIRRER